MAGEERFDVKCAMDRSSETVKSRRSRRRNIWVLKRAVATVSRWGREEIEFADLGNNGVSGRYSRGGTENVGESAEIVEEWRDLWGESGKGDETEGEEEVVDDPSSKSSDSEDLATVGIGGKLGEEPW